MKKSIIIFITMTVLSVGLVVFGWTFVGGQTGEVILTEETITGSIDAAAGLSAGFRADSADTLHWINSFDYSTGETTSSFSRGELEKTVDTSVYDDIRFTGWSGVPYYTQLEYDALGGLQQDSIQAFYEEIQQKVMESGTAETGKIRLKDYLNHYPVSFRFQFGTKIYSSDDTLTAMKVYAGRDMLSAETVAPYATTVELYAAFNNMFKIPVIENEYQEYTVSAVEDFDYKTSLGYEAEIKKPLDEGEDVYQFDPILVIQEENTMDGKKWVHPDLSGGETYDSEESQVGKTASDYNLKNRMLFVVNNKTAKGATIDVSQFGEGYGVYELPIEVTPTATVRHGRRSGTVRSPIPLSDQLTMVYPLDEDAEYVEISLSGDHRYLALFSVKDGSYFAELIDADTWTSDGPIEIFPASEKMTYAWGDDGSLALTNHEDYIAVLIRTENGNEPYEILYSGKLAGGFDEAFFDTAMVTKENSFAKYQYGIDSGLAAISKDGKVALVQNLLVGSPDFNIRNAALECAVLGKSGVLYRGILKSNVVDFEYNMIDDQIQTMKNILDRTTASQVIAPVRNETWVQW